MDFKKQAILEYSNDATETRWLVGADEQAKGNFEVTIEALKPLET